MNNIIVSPQQNSLSPYSDTDKMIAAGQVANHMASGNVFTEHLRYKSEETQKAYAAAVKLFSDALAEIGIQRQVTDLMTDVEAWRGVTWAMVKGYRDWLMSKGYATGSVNQRLSIVRKMADLAGQAGVIDSEEQLKIRGVKGYTSKTAKRADKDRKKARVSNQKDASNFLSREQVTSLLESLPETAQGRRDQLILAMLAYLGMRVSELTALQLSNIDTMTGVIHIYRQKTDTESNIDMPVALRQILADYLEVRPDCDNSQLLVSSKKGGELICQPMSKRAIQGRVQKLGKDILGIDNLSPHDMRHTLAETFAEAGVNEAAAMDVLGWKTSAMYHHYRKRTKVVTVPDVWA